MPTLRLCVGHPTATETLGADELICLRTMKRRYRRIDERPSQHELQAEHTLVAAANDHRATISLPVTGGRTCGAVMMRLVGSVAQ
jgi:hypothetical protein